MLCVEKSDVLGLLGKRIKKLRIERDISQVDLMARMQGNIDITNISRIEAGKTNPTVDSFYRFSEALEISMSELVKFDIEE